VFYADARHTLLKLANFLLSRHLQIPNLINAPLPWFGFNFGGKYSFLLHSFLHNFFLLDPHPKGPGIPSSWVAESLDPGSIG
jgi:hypothetical protein